MSPLAYVAIVVAIFVSGFAGGIKWHAGQDAIAEQARRDKVERERKFAEKRVDVAATARQADSEHLRTEFLVITERVHDALQTEFYAPSAPACLDAGGVRDVNAASGIPDAGSQPAAAVPRPAASR